MDSFRFALSFALIVCLSFLLTFYYLFSAFIRRKEKPGSPPDGFINSGRLFREECILNMKMQQIPPLFADANLFLFLWLLVNVLTFVFLYHKNGDAHAALYQCMKMPFATIIVALIVHPNLAPS